MSKLLVKQRQRNLEELLNELDVPKMRCDVTKPENLRWLTRNLHINNTGTEVTEAISLAHELLTLDQES